MLNELEAFARKYNLISPGDTVFCAVSGGADSMALLWGMYLLAEKLDIRVSAAHFNHHLRGEESQADAQFVRDFCARYAIPLRVGSGHVTPGEKGLEAAAREARYAFLESLPGKVATAHTADDNAETVLMHLIRGAGLRGLGGICPARGKIIRPMLEITRAQVLAFLEEYHIPFVEDSSNASDQFLRNRLRHHVMPLLKAENPRLAENLSAMALNLREDDQALERLARVDNPPGVEALRIMEPALRKRALAAFLQASGVKEPEARHISLAEKLVFSGNPSAWAEFPGGVTIRRCYGHLEAGAAPRELQTVSLSCPGVLELPEYGLRITCAPAEAPEQAPDTFTVRPVGTPVLRCREPGDEIRTKSGTKSLKKLFIDRKIPAHRRPMVPVIADDLGVLGVYGIGPNLDRAARELPGIRIHVEYPSAEG